MNQNYDPTQQRPVNSWETPTGNPSPQQYQGNSLVPNQMNYALWADRVVAALIDAGVAFAGMIALYILLFVLTTVLSAALGAVSPDLGGLLGCGGCFLFFVIPPVSYFVVGLLNKVFWVSSRGYSIGQGVMKLKVVDKDGNLISNGTAFLRLLCQVGLGFVPIVGGLLDLLFPLFDEPTRQTLHDKAVGSYVIKT
jgi:uncharacterized RDD family membrane protein YckC